MPTKSATIGWAMAVWALAAVAAGAVEPPPDFLLAWGSSGTAPGQFRDPEDVATDAAGNVYVSDALNHRIQKFTAEGVFLQAFGTNGGGPGQFREPHGVAVAPDGSIYVADSINHRIQKFDASGTFQLSFGTLGSGPGQLIFPQDVAVGNGAVYVTSPNLHRVTKYDASGAYLGQWGSLGSGDGQLNFPVNLAVAANGEIFVADSGNHRVQVFDANGSFLRKWGSAGTGPGQLQYPYGIAVGPSGAVYVTEQTIDRASKFDASGAFLATWGESGFGNGEFNVPYGIATDAAERIYVADRASHRVQKFGYPFDPCAPAQSTKLLASNGASFFQFGVSVAIDGDRALVGSAFHTSDPGSNLRSAYLFERSGVSWTEVAELVSSDAASTDNFGIAVALDGDVAVVGASKAAGSVPGTGAAYVFERTPGGAWVETAKLFSTDGLADEQFGFAVAVSGDLVAVGAFFRATTSPKSGEVLLFRRDQGGPGAWGQVTNVRAFDPTFGDLYGATVALDGETLAVGARGDDDLGSSSGSVYVYGQNQGGADNWGLFAKLLADDGAATDGFGYAVALSGDTLVASALFHSGADLRSGAAYVFERDLGGANAWGQRRELQAADGATDDHFGVSVAVDADRVVVGARLDDDAGASSGSVYLFERHLSGPHGWGQSAKLVANDGQAGDVFGGDVALAGGTILIGASQDDDDGFQAGSAYLFECASAGAPDLDGDGFDADVDCDDADPDIHPGATELCNSVDDDCDGAIDEGLDTDGDGATDCTDGCPADPAKSAPGICGCGVSDADADGDGTVDCNDSCPADPAKVAPGLCGCGAAELDSDGDGAPDCLDSCPADPAKLEPGLCGCGVPDDDSDGDGAPDCTDLCPFDPAKTAPGLCGCGIADVDSDSDGAADCVDLCPADAAKLESGQCGCGVVDSDADGDGAADCVDLCPADPAKVQPGTCGCGVAELDSDGDGAPDCVDACPADAAKLAPGVCGCAVADDDSDGDGLANCVDACADSDASPVVVIDGCDTGVANSTVAAGCTLADEILGCAAGASNHGKFVSCVAHLTIGLKKAGHLSGAEKGAIDACAAGSSLPN